LAAENGASQAKSHARFRLRSLNLRPFATRCALKAKAVEKILHRRKPAGLRREMQGFAGNSLHTYLTVTTRENGQSHSRGADLTSREDVHFLMASIARKAPHEVPRDLLSRCHA
jgi:hypothetical protein